MATRRSFLALGAVSLIGLGAAGALRAGEPASPLPPPALDETPKTMPAEMAVLAGGCFWGVQGVFQHVRGVTSAVSGYAGGAASTAHYEQVGSGETGHAESVRITYDPRRISYGRILQIYFAVAHDPTQLNYQGPDYGPQYRSAIFPTNPEQERIARAYIAQLTQGRAFGAPIVTRIEPNRPFFPAEGYHQDYLARYPNDPYIAQNDMPKVRQLQRLFPALYSATPMLVGKARF
jgi:peptide-methionine (S)-S-oxide reductase